MRKIKIENLSIFNEPLTLFETSINHNGSLELSKLMLGIAKRVGVRQKANENLKAKQ